MANADANRQQDRVGRFGAAALGAAARVGVGMSGAKAFGEDHLVGDALGLEAGQPRTRMTAAAWPSKLRRNSLWSVISDDPQARCFVLAMAAVTATLAASRSQPVCLR
jgi:hypothetical protein